MAGEVNGGIGRASKGDGREPVAAEAHPPQVDLERFMRGELPRRRALKIVRHLLTGCPWCIHITGQLWARGEPLPGLVALAEEMDRTAQRRNLFRTHGGLLFMKATAAARAQLLDILRQLEAIRFRLMGVESSLPQRSSDLAPLVEIETMDAVVEIRAVIQCVLRDSIDQAIRDLGELATLPEERP